MLVHSDINPGPLSTHFKKSPLLLVRLCLRKKQFLPLQRCYPASTFLSTQGDGRFSQELTHLWHKALSLRPGLGTKRPPCSGTINAAALLGLFLKLKRSPPPFFFSLIVNGVKRSSVPCQVGEIRFEFHTKPTSQSSTGLWLAPGASCLPPL